MDFFGGLIRTRLELQGWLCTASQAEDLEGIRSHDRLSARLRGEIEQNGMSWAYRAKDARNYYANKIVIRNPGRFLPPIWSGTLLSTVSSALEPQRR